MFMNRKAKVRTWEWLQDNWRWLKDHLGKDLSFSRFPVYAARMFSGEEFLAAYKAFFGPKLEPSLERAYKQGIEMITQQTAWRARDLEGIKAFFASHQ
jgi:aminopeptidase N